MTPSSIYDTARSPRRFEFVPVWGFVVFLVYHMRRVSCPNCGVTTEWLPWAEGKQRCCKAYRSFLASWARRMPWSEVAGVFGTSWNVVSRAVEWVVKYGLEHRSLDGITSIGVDEVSIRKGQDYLTVVYQIDSGVRRLLWVGQDRTEACFEKFFEVLGEQRTRAIEFVASDMWKPYLNVIARNAEHAFHVLDRFHIMANLNKAVNDVRNAEAKQMEREGFLPLLRGSRWCFLKRPENLTEKQEAKLNEVLQYDLRSVRAYLLKEAFNAFWSYSSPYWAGWFLDKWCTRAMRSKLPQMKKFAKSMRKHRELLLNWFRASGQVSSGAVEGLNTNVKVALRKARGFKNPRIAEIALYHELGRLPEPPVTHRFC